MIYFGVQLLPEAFKVVALSEGFALLDERCFTDKEYDKIKPWVDSVKIDSHESARWFFDEMEFKNYEHGFILGFLNQSDSINLINHRKLSNVVQFFRESVSRDFYFTPTPETAFFMASAVRLFDNEQIILLDHDTEVS